MMNNTPPPGARLYYDFTTDPFCQKALDRSMINIPFDNLLTNSQFVDSDGNGIPDNWSTYNPSGIVADYSLENEYAKIELTESTTASTGPQLSQNITNIAPGQVFSCRCVAKVSSSNVRALLQISYYTGAGYGGIIGNTATTTSETDTVLSVENAVIPSTAVRIQILLRLLPTASGDTGVGWFKSPELIRHSTFKQPDKSAWLYGSKWTPSGLEFDGIDNYCQVENNADADITVATPEKPLTIGIVTRPTEASTMFALSKNYRDTTTYQYAICYNPDNKRLQAIMSDLNNAYSPGIAVDVGELVYYVVSYNGLTIKEFKNGLLSGSAARTGALISRPYFHLGCKMNNPTSGSRSLFYKGTISEIYIGHAQPYELISWFERTGRFEKYGIPR